MYAQNNQGFYPIGRHDTYAANGIQQRWHDRLVPYVTSSTRDNSLTSTADYQMLKENSVIYGCPEWQEKDDQGITFARTGYGMQIYPGVPEKPTTDLASWALKTPSLNGRYYKASEWGKQGSDRLLIADGSFDYINVPSTARPDSGGKIDPAVHSWWPFSTATTDIWLDGARHGKAGVTKQQSYNNKYMNALFCDGHAEPVSVRQAWQAMMAPGKDTATP
jgi:prepilin-type processing-associated H-X9-DG protein